jgi:hypothetical protein
VYWVPTAALACDEECSGIYDYNGRLVGHGCISGNDGENCEATVEECEIDYCGQPMAVLTGVGAPVELSGICAAPSLAEAPFAMPAGSGFDATAASTLSVSPPRSEAG